MAVVSKTLNRESHIMKLLKLMWYAPIFLLSKKRRQSQFKSFITSGDVALIMKIAKFSGSPLSRFMFYLLNPGIKFHKKIYISRNYEKVTIDSLHKILDEFLTRGDTKKSIEASVRKKIRESHSFNYKAMEKLEEVPTTFQRKSKKDLLCISKYNHV